MTLDELRGVIQGTVEENPSLTNTIRWVNTMISTINLEMDISVPHLSFTAAGGESLPLPNEYSALFINFCCAKSKEFDGSIGDASYYMNEFKELKKEFISTYQVPVYYRNDRLVQQFVASQDQTVFTVTKEGYEPKYGDLKVFINGVRETDPIINDDNTFETSARSAGDKVTALWEEHTDMVEPPYMWWRW